MSARDRLSTTGVWYHTDTMSAGEAAEFAGRVADMGYSTLWLPDTVGRDPFAHIAWLASQVDTLQFATGIANIFHRHAGPMMQVANTLAEQTGGRFVLGLGVSHGPLVAGLRGLDYSKPYTTMKNYLAAMDASPYHGAKAAEKPLRLLAALGPKMLELPPRRPTARIPTSPRRTTRRRPATSSGPTSCCVWSRRSSCRPMPTPRAAAANITISGYAALPNYRNNWLRSGFTEEEIEQRDPRFVDAVVVWGDEDRVKAGVQAHYDAGADHVCVQPLSLEGPATLDWRVLEVLAPNG